MNYDFFMNHFFSMSFSICHKKPLSHPLAFCPIHPFSPSRSSPVARRTVHPNPLIWYTLLSLVRNIGYSYVIGQKNIEKMNSHWSETIFMLAKKITYFYFKNFKLSFAKKTLNIILKNIKQYITKNLHELLVLVSNHTTKLLVLMGLGIFNRWKVHF